MCVFIKKQFWDGKANKCITTKEKMQMRCQSQGEKYVWDETRATFFSAVQFSCMKLREKCSREQRFEVCSQQNKYREIFVSEVVGCLSPERLDDELIKTCEESDADFEKVKQLIDVGAKISWKALQASIKNEHENIVQYFIERKYKVSGNDLLSAVASGSEKIVDLILKSGVNPNLGRDSRSPLAIAVKKGYANIVVLLLKAGADSNWWDDQKLKSILYIAVEEGHVEVLKLLLEAKVGVNSGGYQGRYLLPETCLDLAERLYGFDSEIYRLLRNKGAKSWEKLRNEEGAKNRHQQYQQYEGFGGEEKAEDNPTCEGFLKTSLENSQKHKICLDVNGKKEQITKPIGA